jgi:CAAX protease family protein
VLLPDAPTLDNQANQSPLSASASGNIPQTGVARTNAAIRRDLIVFLVVGFILPSLILIASNTMKNPDGDVSTIQRELWVKGIAAFFVALATWIAARRQRRSMGDYGIPPRQAFGRRFWEGALWGFAALSVLLFVLRAIGHFQIGSVTLQGPAIFRYALGWAIVFLCVAVHEEFTFRGYLFFVAARRIRFWPAAVALSIGFAVAHIPNPGETSIGILQVLGTGLLFCFMIRRTGNLWFALGYHAFWDWAQTFFYGTADSGLLGEGRLLNTSAHGPGWITGGSTGPEGSIFSLLVLLFCALLVRLRFPRALYPDVPV